MVPIAVTTDGTIVKDAPFLDQVDAQASVIIFFQDVPRTVEHVVDFVARIHLKVFVNQLGCLLCEVIDGFQFAFSDADHRFVDEWKMNRTFICAFLV